MTNVPFDDIANFQDIESLNYFREAMADGADRSTVLQMLRTKSRDNARTPMQWTAEPGAGFSDATPWIQVNPNHTWLNAARQVQDPASIYHYYRRLIALRRSEPILVEGTFTLLEVEHEDLYAFRRELGGRGIEVFANLSDSVMTLTQADLGLGEILVDNYPDEELRAGRLAPWEARAYRR